MGCSLLKTSILEAANYRIKLVLEGKLMKWTKKKTTFECFWMGV